MQSPTTPTTPLPSTTTPARATNTTTTTTSSMATTTTTKVPISNVFVTQPNANNPNAPTTAASSNNANDPSSTNTANSQQSQQQQQQQQRSSTINDEKVNIARTGEKDMRHEIGLLLSRGKNNRKLFLSPTAATSTPPTSSSSSSSTATRQDGDDDDIYTLIPQCIQSGCFYYVIGDVIRLRLWNRSSHTMKFLLFYVSPKDKVCQIPLTERRIYSEGGGGGGVEKQIVVEDEISNEVANPSVRAFATAAAAAASAANGGGGGGGNGGNGGSANGHHGDAKLLRIEREYKTDICYSDFVSIAKDEGKTVFIHTKELPDADVEGKSKIILVSTAADPAQVKALDRITALGYTSYANQRIVKGDTVVYVENFVFFSSLDDCMART